VIPPKSNHTKTICYNKQLYRQRNCIERVLGRLKINRAIATRYDQLVEPPLESYISHNRVLLDQICPRNLALLWQIYSRRRSLQIHF
jgi:transposase